jgi:site-specific recombinase XerD
MNKHRNRSNHHEIEAEIAPFVANLKAAGYAAGTLCTKRVALRHFVTWRQVRKKSATEPSEIEVAEFMATSCQLGPRHRCLASKALLGFLEHLRRHKLIKPCTSNVSKSACSDLQSRYADFLLNDKGLAEKTILVYTSLVSDFLKNMEKRRGIRALRLLDAGTLRAFILERARDRSRESVRLLAISLRSFLRFLHAQGEIRNDLTAAIPTVRKGTQPGIPKKLTPDEVDRVLKAPDRTTPTGRRDYAILLLLARLGLRSSEILSLELGDIRWRTGEILIRGKGGRQDLLPLPHDVGTAIARYLRLDRGPRPSDRVFLRTNAPRVPLTVPASVGHIVRGTMVKAGVERPRQIAAHLFRHTLASRMLQQGANLRDISEALRHRACSSTEIYAKIDMRSLNEVVRPWLVQGGAQ